MDKHATMILELVRGRDAFVEPPLQLSIFDLVMHPLYQDLQS